jgi:hypothetical protein
VLGVMLLLAIPLVFLMPDRAWERREADVRTEHARTEAEVAAARATVEAGPRSPLPVTTAAVPPTSTMS